MRTATTPRYHGFRLLAVDGSVMELPNTPALQAYYGTSENQSPHGTLARARSSTLYDILNWLVVHTILGRYDRGQRDISPVTENWLIFHLLFALRFSVPRFLPQAEVWPLTVVSD